MLYLTDAAKMCPNFSGPENRAEFKLEIMEVFRAVKQRQYLKNKSAEALLEETEEETEFSDTNFDVQFDTEHNNISEAEDYSASQEND